MGDISSIQGIAKGPQSKKLVSNQRSITMIHRSLFEIPIMPFPTPLITPTSNEIRLFSGTRFDIPPETRTYFMMNKARKVCAGSKKEKKKRNKNKNQM